MILQTNVFAGTVVKMDPETDTPELMEPNINTSAIVVVSEGVVYLFSYHQFYKIEDEALETIGSTLDDPITMIAIDHNDDIFYPADHYLNKFDENSGTTTRYVTLVEGYATIDMEYDFVNNEMVVLVKSLDENDETLLLLRASTEKNSTYSKEIEIEMEDSDNSAIMLDRTTGNVYFYNRDKNNIYYVNEETEELEVVVSNVLDEDRAMAAGFNYFSPLEGFVITNVDEGRSLFPLDGSASSVFSEVAYGMDCQQGYEDANGYYYGTNAGVLYRIRPE